jgi:excinuclease ABC subunit C
MTASNPAFDIPSFLEQLTSKPGVYRMLDEHGEVIYVGKAKNLKKRVSSYFNKNDSSPKTRVMVKQINRIEVTVTNTEIEALLLENNLIKELKPRYNVVFRDDKSYPYILLTEGEYPRLAYHRGAKKEKGEYFGPFPSSSAVRHSLSLLQKLFQVRQCEDSVFKNRSRPCLQYQIKRCKAPCVGYISQAEYAIDVELTRLFYRGKNELVMQKLTERMEQAANNLDFESAAELRDQIASLRKLVGKQVISGAAVNADIFAVVSLGEIACVVVMFIRQGRVLGSNTYYPKFSTVNSEEELAESFVTQFYISGKAPPDEIIINRQSLDTELLAEAIRSLAGRQVRVATKVRADRADWLDLAMQNAHEALQTRLNLKANQRQKLKALMQELGLSQLPEHMECFDISHTMGEQTVASCVVFKGGAPHRQSYRRFNIHDITPGDDYAAIEQAVFRRYSRVIKEDAALPNLIIIDGGKGQLKAAQKALSQLGLSEVECIGVAKGVERKAGMEQVFKPGSPIPQVFDSQSLGLHLLQHIRDEAHRFAITGHRHNRGKARTKSWLEEIPGVGPKKRQVLLKHFGGLKNIETASLADLRKVPGIHQGLAEKIYNYLHQD